MYHTTYQKLSQLRGNKSKYRNIKTHGFDSKKEYHYACELEILKKGKVIKDYEKQKRIELRGANGTKVCSYIADFIIHHLDGTTEIIDVKSGFTKSLPTFRLKWKLLEDLYQDEIRKGIVKLTIAMR
jgi:hypothetical protein